MEYVPGGDFRTLLNNSGVLKEEHAKFYICEMFAAVNELHKLGYIHRDLKPEVGMFLLMSSSLTVPHPLPELSRRLHRSRQTYGLRPCHRRLESKAYRVTESQGSLLIHAS